MAKAFKHPEGFEPPTITMDDFRDGTWQAKEQEYIDRLADRCKMNGTNPLHGEVISFPVADGAAQYMVWKTQPLQLIWLELGDAWSITEPHLRGLRLADVREQVDHAARMREFFASKGGE